jgi:low affinity Fe/Cu permease
MREYFARFASRAASGMGSSVVFGWALLLVLTWAMTGPLFDYSTSWQLFINTFTTITTFLMVFIIQNTQNRDAKATHIKLDELLKAIHGARNSLVSAEELSEKELDHLLAEFHEIHKKYEREITKKGGKISLS